MRGLSGLIAVLLLLATPVFGSTSGGVYAAPSARDARIYRDIGAQARALPASPRDAVESFLATNGRDARTVRSLVSAGSVAPAPGLRHLRFEQEVDGLRVYGAYARASFDSSGRMIHLIDALAPIPYGRLLLPTISERDALNAVLPIGGSSPGIPREGRMQDGNSVAFDGGPSFYRNPTVTRVAIPLRDGGIESGFLVETWSRKDNVLLHTLVGSDGRVLHRELRTNNDSYNVFVEDPLKGNQTVVFGPGSGNAESPSGWLGSGAQNSVSISGNNVHAYLDTDADNAPDAGGVPVTDGNFLTPVDLTQQPSTADNSEVSVQNLFYLNNVIHDILYKAGFDEAAGNFQVDNFGNGGADGDPVNAESQDSGGTDNANFATPSDGSSPRMQIYLWSVPGTHELFVNAPGDIAGAYDAAPAFFGPSLDATGVTGDVVQAVDSGGNTDGCSRLPRNSLSGVIALIDRGSCNFTDKVENAQSAGAIGVIIVNNAGNDAVAMGGTSHRAKVPAIGIGQSDGDVIKSALGSGVNATLRLRTPPPLMLDASLDSDIVFHEYGHGLTWRMIGKMDGVMSGAIGEGMSDVIALLVNGDDRIGEYSANNALGIRSEPYDTYSRTYGDVAGSEVHFDGEVLGAIGWRLAQNYQAIGLTNDDVLGDVVGGMNFTPAGPAFEDIRDGILAQVDATGSGRECLVWSAFAEYGVGVGASATVRGPNVKVTESFALPPACTP